MRYEKLPKKTPQSLVVAILLVGACLGYAIMINGFITLYGLFGLFGNLFFENSITINTDEALFLGLLALAAGLTTTIVIVLAMYMNQLSKRARPLSLMVWLPLAITWFLTWRHNALDGFEHHIGGNWVIAAAVSVVLGGIVPAYVLSGKAARRLHSR